MSGSTLWVMNSSFKGEELREYANSWQFSPVAWDILLEKYIPKKPYEKKRNYISSVIFNNKLHGNLNEAINASKIQEDRILWEISNQQVFFTKDKLFVSNGIKNFLKINEKFCEEIGEHIYERFSLIANEIAEIDESKYPYFIFKNTSCDDNVESWFSKYDEELKGGTPCGLNELNQSVTEFVVIEDNVIARFISNLEFFENKAI